MDNHDRIWMTVSITGLSLLSSYHPMFVWGLAMIAVGLLLEVWVRDLCEEPEVIRVIQGTADLTYGGKKYKRQDTCTTITIADMELTLFNN